MARINQHSIDTVRVAQRYANCVNNHNSAAITKAQNAFAACKCSENRCPHELKLWAEIERGEDMQIAARLGAK